MISNKQLNIIYDTIGYNDLIGDDQEKTTNIIKTVCEALGQEKTGQIVGWCMAINHEWYDSRNSYMWTSDTLSIYFLSLYEVITKYGNTTSKTNNGVN